MKKRGMLSEPFVYIFIIIVIAFIFLFGFRIIGKLSNLNEKTVYLTFKSDFLESVDNLYYKNEGSTLVFDRYSRNKPLILPNDIKKVCFEDNNVSFMPNNYESFNVDNLIVSNNITSSGGCINVIHHTLSFRLTNVVISQEVFVEIDKI